MENKFNVGDKVKCIKTENLSGFDVAPPLTLGDDYVVKEIILDSKKNQHLDVGLQSKYNWITSHDTGEKLPHGDSIHWCHPSRFEKIGWIR